ncbi:MAG: DUF2185 domain-containing protein [Sphingomonadaceae bacterium]|nr:DUF2185 domain-containing protein [Sphingomonadaceae bacterium]
MSGIDLPPGISVRDPRPVAARSPYTFFLPHQDELHAIGPGDGIKAIFYDTSETRKYDAERMWVLVEKVEDGWVTGTLDNDPSDMPSFKAGDRLCIPLNYAIATAYVKDKRRPDVPEKRQYWDRCFVDACVVEGRSHPDYIYREEPDMTRDGDEYPDSGWRIRGTQAAIDEDEANDDKPLYIALGAVLNKDDRWLHLIDREYGSAFQWDEDTSSYFELE